MRLWIATFLLVSPALMYGSLPTYRSEKSQTNKVDIYSEELQKSALSYEQRRFQARQAELRRVDGLRQFGEAQCLSSDTVKIQGNGSGAIINKESLDSSYDLLNDLRDSIELNKKEKPMILRWLFGSLG